MEKNAHNDPLDNFVKKSFQDYSEDPAADMWERVEQQLSATVDRVPLWHAWRSHRWQLVAAAVILLLISRLVYVQIAYEKNLRTISEQQQQAFQQLVPAAPAAEVLPEAAIAENSDITSKTENIQAHNPIVSGGLRKNKHTQKSTADFLPSGLMATAEKPARQQADTEEFTNKHAVQPNSTAIQTDTSTLENATRIIEDPVTSDAATKIEFADFQQLAQKESLLSFSNNEHPSKINLPTKRYKQSSGWYAGLSISPQLILEKSRQTLRPGNPRQLYASLQEKPHVSADVWLRAGKKLNRRFALESGLGFQQLSRTASHRVRFEYRDGRPEPPAGGAESRNFEYDLNTYGGSASVSLRTELRGSDVPAENERLGAVVSTRERIQLLHVPVLGVARLGHGRMRAVLKAGMQASYLLKNEFTVAAYSLENDKLRLRGSDGYRVQYNRPQHFIFGYQASAGLEFRLNKNISLAAVPTLSGDFPRGNPQLGKMPAHTTFGIDVGANWWF